MAALTHTRDVSPGTFDFSGFRREVYQVVSAIPAGRVISYGEIARLLGQPSRSRMVGRALKNAPEHLPCHRVVNSQGRLAPGWAEQRNLLASEGVRFRPGGHVDMVACRWNTEEYPD